MAMAASAYRTKLMPTTAPNLPAQKKALRGSLAGPVLFYRARVIALSRSSADRQCRKTSTVTGEVTRKRLFGFLCGLVKDGRVFLSIFAVFKVVHARNDFFHAIGNKVFAFACRRGFFAADNRKRVGSAFLGHCDGSCRASNQNEASNGHCDFTTFGSAHNPVSLAVINLGLLMGGRGVPRAPLFRILPVHCAGKRDQMCVFRGKLRAKTPQFFPQPRFGAKVFFECIVGRPSAPGCP